MSSKYFAYPTTYEGERAVLYYTGGPIYYHVGGSMAWRNNNPGNCYSGNSSARFNETGLSRDTILNTLSSSNRTKLLGVIMKKEGQ